MRPVRALQVVRGRFRVVFTRMTQVRGSTVPFSEVNSPGGTGVHRGEPRPGVPRGERSRGLGLVVAAGVAVGLAVVVVAIAVHAPVWLATVAAGAGGLVLGQLHLRRRR